jgi:hypothetical protein
VIGSAGWAGAGPQLDATLAMVHDIAREDELHFRLGAGSAAFREVLTKSDFSIRCCGRREIGAAPPLTRRHGYYASMECDRGDWISIDGARDI